MVHSLIPPPLVPATATSSRTMKMTTMFTSPSLGSQTVRACCQHQHFTQTQADISAAAVVHRRSISLGLAAGLVLGCSQSANAAGKRAPPPPPTEKKDPSVTGVLAKVLASRKRKEALKEAAAKLREKGKPTCITNIFSDGGGTTREVHDSTSNSSVELATGKIKINCDGSKLGKFGYAGYGGVLRDEDGLWIKGYMGHLGHSSILEAELWGIHRGLIIIYGLNLRDVIIETDCQEAAKSIQEEAEEGFPYSMMVQNIRDLLARCNAVVKVISREINVVADFLAKKGREQKETLVILEEPPSDLHDLLIQDMIHCSSKCD